MNEVKKRLYKEKPDAFLMTQAEECLIYSTNTSEEEIIFKIPYDEGKDFNGVIKAQLLIRWIDKVN